MTDLIVEPCGPVLGAEVRGLSIGAEGPSEAWVVTLRALLNEHKVLFFRDLEILSSRGSKGRVTDAAVTRQFRATDKWHVDVTFRADPSLSAVLRARELASLSSGDTLWVDAAAAYEGLADEVKERI
jgi:taurine dioxygenase